MRTALVGLAFVFSAVAAAAAQGVDDSVVFAQQRDGNWDIYLSSLDGRHVRRLTSDPAPDEIPRCSPDGRDVVFLRGGFERGDLYRVDVRTGEEFRLTNDQIRDSTPQWSADGRQIYFTRREGKFDRLAVINRDGSGLRYLTDGDGWHDTMPGVSPDGRTLVHHTYRYPPGTELHVLDTTTLTTRRLTNAPGFDYEASFAGPDRVLFSSNRETKHYRLYVIGTDGTGTRLLADTGADAWGSRYSPRSRRVVFHSGAARQWRLFTVDIDGSAPPQPLLHDEHVKASADWCSPEPSPPGRSDDALGVTAMRAEMRPLAGLVGEFDLSALETGTDGSRFTERGTRTCQWVMGETAIHCEDNRTLEDATGRYAQLPAHRRSMRVVRWNQAGKYFEQVEMGMTGTPGVRALRFDATRGALSYDSVVESTSMQQTLDNASTLTIGPDRHELVQHLRSRTTDFQEEYRETAVRQSDGIRAATQRYVDAWLANDAERVMATMAPGAVLLPSGMSPIAGEAAIRAFWFPATGPATRVTAMSNDIDHVTEHGDLAVVRGTGSLSFTLRHQDGKEQSATQRSWFVNVLRRQADGRWLIAERAWSDLRR